MALENEELRKVRLRDIAMVPQAAMNALNPVMRVEAQIKDALTVHVPGHVQAPGRRDRGRTRCTWSTCRVDIAKSYPHQLSGGMKQRATMAIAVALRPKVIIADEPTSALDVVVQKRVMMTLMRLQEELGSAVILIGHDIGLIAQFADTLGVLYAGRLVEWAPVEDILDNAYHPYSRLLIDSLPSLSRKEGAARHPGHAAGAAEPAARLRLCTRAARMPLIAAASRCRPSSRSAARAHRGVPSLSDAQLLCPDTRGVDDRMIRGSRPEGELGSDRCAPRLDLASYTQRPLSERLYQEA